jgi:hypothetical protein
MARSNRFVKLKGIWKQYLTVHKCKSKTHTYVSKRRFDGSFMYVAPQLHLPVSLDQGKSGFGNAFILKH